MKIRFYPIFMLLSIGSLVPLVLSSCSKSNDKTAANADVDYYTCTMHPSVHSKDPGKCPICSMDLVPVKKKGANETNVKENSGGMTDSGSRSMGSMPMPSPNLEAGKPSEFSVPVERQQQIGVTYATATKRPIELSIRSVGMLEPDTSKMFDYVARVDGYVQQLKVSSPGQDVTQGQPLITIYSPDLRSTEQELVNILNDRDRGGTSRVSNDQMIDASKRRLKLWNVSDQEIAELEKSRKPSDQLVLRSPFDGVVGEVMSRPGMNVKMGDKLVSVLDLSNLWVWAEFYENEIGLLKRGQQIDVSLGLPAPRRQQPVADLVIIGALPGHQVAQAARIDQLEPVFAARVGHVQPQIDPLCQPLQDVQVQRRRGRQAEDMRGGRKTRAGRCAPAIRKSWNRSARTQSAGCPAQTIT